MLLNFRQECQRGKTASVRRGDAAFGGSRDQSVVGGGIWENSHETPGGNWESRTSRERPRSAKGRNRRSRHGDQQINQQVWPQ